MFNLLKVSSLTKKKEVEMGMEPRGPESRKRPWTEADQKHYEEVHRGVNKQEAVPTWLIRDDTLGPGKSISEGTM